jgi:hypothetical protein
MTAQELEKAINELIVNDFQQLVQLLYRLDISEKKLRDVLQDQPNELAGHLITGLILEREAQKKASRAQFKPSGPIPDDEKW